MVTFSTLNERPEVKFIPRTPRVAPAPLIDRFRTMTSIVPGVAVALSLTLIPLTPDAELTRVFRCSQG